MRYFNDLLRLLPQRMVKFIITGGVNTILSYLCFVLLISLNVNYILASGFGYTLAMLNSYFLNKKWTFSSTKPTSVKLLSQFITINLLTLGGSLALLSFSVEVLDINVYISQLIAIIFTMIFNYIGYKLAFK